MYIATHPANSIVRFNESGARTTIAGPAEGAAGATAAALAPGERMLYVTTNGGMWSPFEAEVQSAKLLCLDIRAGDA